MKNTFPGVIWVMVWISFDVLFTRVISNFPGLIRPCVYVTKRETQNLDCEGMLLWSLLMCLTFSFPRGYCSVGWTTLGFENGVTDYVSKTSWALARDYECQSWAPYKDLSLFISSVFRRSLINACRKPHDIPRALLHRRHSCLASHSLVGVIVAAGQGCHPSDTADPRSGLCCPIWQSTVVSSCSWQSLFVSWQAATATGMRKALRCPGCWVAHGRLGGMLLPHYKRNC